MSNSSQTYIVRTEKFGDIPFEADDIRDARKRAKAAFGAGPRCVWREQAYVHCDDCSCAPCCCRKDSP